MLIKSWITTIMDGRYRFVWTFLIFMILHELGVKAIIPTAAPNRPKKCTYHKAYRMNGAYCSGLNLHSVPANLKTNIEILDLSENRIRDLKNSTFSYYGSVKFLYLGDNMIQFIDVLAFEPLSSLEVLDLSLNGLRTIPSYILNLPALRKLYMSENTLTQLNTDLEKTEKPIKAPLQFLSLSYCSLTKFPDFGILPDLESLNVSGNEFKELTTKDFTSLCKLKTLDLTSSYYNEDVCFNKPLVTWFIEKTIMTVPELYSIFNPNSEELKKCQDIVPSEEDDIAFDECRAKIQTIEKEKVIKKTWIIIAGSLAGFLILGVIFLCCMHRRNTNQTKRHLNNSEKHNVLKSETKKLNDHNDP